MSQYRSCAKPYQELMRNQSTIRRSTTSYRVVYARKKTKRSTMLICSTWSSLLSRKWPRRHTKTDHSATRSTVISSLPESSVTSWTYLALQNGRCILSTTTNVGSASAKSTLSSSGVHSMPSSRVAGSLSLQRRRISSKATFSWTETQT